MKKTEQSSINAEVKEYLAKAIEESKTTRKIGRLRTCKATVYETTNFYILCSYNTTIACIYKPTDTLVDFLRLVYGYTATSAHHINKFGKEYGKGNFGCENNLRYYEV